MDATAEPSVCAVVVTHNREELLERCLGHLRAQSRRPDKILVVDNASTDGTAELLARQDDLEVLRLPVERRGSRWLQERARECLSRRLRLDVAARRRHLRRASMRWSACWTGRLARRSSPSVMTSLVRWRDRSPAPDEPSVVEAEPPRRVRAGGWPSGSLRSGRPPSCRR